jgi:hypothetical protein
MKTVSNQVNSLHIPGFALEIRYSIINFRVNNVNIDITSWDLAGGIRMEYSDPPLRINPLRFLVHHHLPSIP